MTLSANGRQGGAAKAAVTCPECGVEVEPHWDWCQHCGFDPYHLRPAAQAAAPAEPAPTPPVAAPAPAAPAPTPAAAGPPGPPRPRTAPPPRRAPAAAPVATPAALPPLGAAEAGWSGLRPQKQRSARWAWFVLALLAVVATGVIAIVSVLRSEPSTTVRSKNLDAKLLKVSDMPAGWQPVPPTSPLDGTSVACVAAPPPLEAKGASVPVAAAAYRSPGGVPNVFEQLEQYSPGRAATRWGELVGDVLNGCGPPKDAAPVTVPALVRPPEGDQSATFALPVSDGTTVALFIGRVRGTVVVFELNDGKIDPAFLQQTISRAVAKLSD